jgi:PASTA domain
MNPLDELLSRTGRVPDVTSEGMRNARAALDAATAEASAQRNGTLSQRGLHAHRKATSRWRGGARGKTIIGATAVAAAAAIAAAVVVPLSSSHPGTPPRADSSAKTAVKASETAKPKPKQRASVPATVRVSAPLVTATFSATTDVTAVYVLDKAAQAVRATQVGSAPLVNGWPNATYWHTLSQGSTSTCPGQVDTSNIWLAKAGYAIGDNTMTGPKLGDPLSACGGGANLGVYPIEGEPDGVQIGGQIYTWPQFAALPTDPAKLWPIVEADANVGVAPGKGGLTFDFETIGILLADDPVASGMQEALYRVLEKIPGVTVAGTYTDSLGRTGTALRLGSSTFVIDSGNGQILAELGGAPPVPPGCVRSSLTGDPHATCEVGGANVTVFISAGPAATAPKVKGFSTSPFTMPSVIGDTSSQATHALTRAGFRGFTIKDSPGASGGVVVAQSPAAGSTVIPGTLAAITLGS